MQLQIYAADHCNNKCQFCSTCSPYKPHKFSDADKICDILNFLYDRGIIFSSINITGGEPFLHPEFEKFSYTIRRKYKNKNFYFDVTTNAFWLYLKKIIKNIPTINCYDGVNISQYSKNILEKSCLENYNIYVHILKDLTDTQIGLVPREIFRKLSFVEEKQKKIQNCGFTECLALSDEGYFCRCCFASGARFHPEVSKSFLKYIDELFYVIDSNIDKNNFLKWYNSFPYKSCYFCTACEEIRSTAINTSL